MDFSGGMGSVGRMDSSLSQLSSRRTFLLQASLVGAGLGVQLPSFLYAESSPPKSTLLPRGNPAAEGVSAQGILDFLDAAEKAKIELHSFMMLRHGRVIAEGWWEPYAPDLVHTMYSMSKSFTSTAVGFAVAEGKMKVDDKVISFFPDELPGKVSDNLAKMQVKHLLSMATGNEKEPTGATIKEENWVKAFLAQNFAHEPGSAFMYNSAATYMCSAIVQKVTGKTILEYLTPRLFEPLGITGMRWETCPRGINVGGWGLSIQTEGLAKFGHLLLQKGAWNGKQLLPAAWIEEATSKHIQQPGGDKPDRPKAQNDWLQGYGYQFWRCQGTAFRGDGAFGQFTIVMPEQDAVVVMTAESKNMQGQIDLVWKHLLPACDAKESPAPDSETATRLVDKLRDLKLEVPKGSQSSPLASVVSGKLFVLEPNALNLGTATIVVNEKSFTLLATTSTDAKLSDVTGRIESWLKTEAAVPGTPPRLIAGGKPRQTPVSKIAASGTWTDPKILTMTLRYYETPHTDTVTCMFSRSGDEVAIEFRSSIAGPRESRPMLRGRMVG
jgi:CubicO group peptidase (beta-lactamase class C family)